MARAASRGSDRPDSREAKPRPISRWSARSSRTGKSGDETRSKSATTGMPASRASRAARIVPATPRWLTNRTRVARISSGSGPKGSGPTKPWRSEKTFRVPSSTPMMMVDRIGRAPSRRSRCETFTPSRTKLATTSSESSSSPSTPAYSHCAPEPGGRHQGGTGQASALPLSTQDRRLGVGRRIGGDIEQVVDRDGTEAQDVEAVHLVHHVRSGMSAGISPGRGAIGRDVFAVLRPDDPDGAIVDDLGQVSPGLRCPAERTAGILT